jgi:hypothetical protein
VATRLGASVVGDFGLVVLDKAVENVAVALVTENESSSTEVEDAVIALIRLRMWDVASVIDVEALAMDVEAFAMDVEVFVMDVEASAMEEAARVTGLASWAERLL